MWNARAESLTAFFQVANELLGIVLDLMANPPGDLPFPELAIEVDTLDEVRGAFDAYISEPEELSQLPDISQDTIDQAELLRDVLIDIDGDPTGPNFTLVVGRGGVEVGRLRCSPAIDRDRVTVDVRLAAPPSDPPATSLIRDALAESGDLLSVHYASGHHLARHGLTRINQAHHPFKRWSFVDYTGFDRRREKPAVVGAQAIHDAIGMGGDDSLFSWIAQHFVTGHLTCDDGSNEVADFVHLADDGTLTLVHAKAASVSASHRVSSGSFELVVSQAVKNLWFLTNERIIEALTRSPLLRPATWYAGVRVADRTAMLAALRHRTSTSDMHIIIVQPHHTRTMHDSLLATAAAGGSSQDLTRFQLIETMLTTARSSAVGLGGDLHVWASAE